ncbi:hypothetical protein [Clostridium botulinum]|uniref:hypothetical protein n=1 Tax=Clostridium botulinum TaxID=1491 RepID=UPI000A173D70|nr:hypothetical protein [Clostridium botulinum]OSA81293.1 hypothetical protein B2H89_03345 [Clostridium botulinum]
MFIYKNKDTFSTIVNPFDPVHGILNSKGVPYTETELLKFGFFIDEIPDKPTSPKYEYIMKVDFDTEMVYYDKIPVRSMVSEETKMDFLTKELASSKLESMKLKGLLKFNAEEIAKTKVSVMQLKGVIK